MTGSVRMYISCDNFTLGQFVVGFVSKVLDTANTDIAKNMLLDLVETVKLAESLSWPIARRGEGGGGGGGGAFALAMPENRLTHSQTVMFNGSVTMSPRPDVEVQQAGNLKCIICKWYSGGSC